MDEMKNYVVRYYLGDYRWTGPATNVGSIDRNIPEPRKALTIDHGFTVTSQASLNT
jgi:hypothetical protein